MKAVLVWVFAATASATFKPTYERANRSEVSVEELLLGRSLLERQSCDAGYGLCDNGGCCPLSAGCCGDGCINLDNTCCYGYVCPPGSGCCGYDGYCKPSGYGCCGSDGYVYPLDGSECCSDGGHCPPGSSCVYCDSSRSDICCLGADGDYVNPDYGTDIDTVTYPSSTSADYTTTFTSDDYTTYTSDSYETSTYTYLDYSYYYLTYTFYYISWYPDYTPTTSTTVTETTILSVYASDSADASRSLADETSSIMSFVSFSESLYSPETVVATSTRTVSAPSGSSAGEGTTGSAVASAKVNGAVGWVFVGLAIVVGGLAFGL